MFAYKEMLQFSPRARSVNGENIFTAASEKRLVPLFGPGIKLHGRLSFLAFLPSAIKQMMHIPIDFFLRAAHLPNPAVGIVSTLSHSQKLVHCVATQKKYTHARIIMHNSQS